MESLSTPSSTGGGGLPAGVLTGGAARPPRGLLLRGALAETMTRPPLGAPQAGRRDRLQRAPQPRRLEGRVPPPPPAPTHHRARRGQVLGAAPRPPSGSRSTRVRRGAHRHPRRHCPHGPSRRGPRPGVPRPRASRGGLLRVPKRRPAKGSAGRCSRFSGPATRIQARGSTTTTDPRGRGNSGRSSDGSSTGSCRPCLPARPKSFSRAPARRSLFGPSGPCPRPRRPAPLPTFRS